MKKKKRVCFQIVCFWNDLLNNDGLPSSVNLRLTASPEAKRNTFRCRGRWHAKGVMDEEKCISQE
jgi:hypothetical protein